MTLTDYRMAVVAAVGCDFCGAAVNEPCGKPMISWTGVAGDAERVEYREPVPYVHDDRSATYHARSMEEVFR